MSTTPTARSSADDIHLGVLRQLIELSSVAGGTAPTWLAWTQSVMATALADSYINAWLFPAASHL
ncbi:hypothetical protein M378DRAFT_16893 [Amanita muscaria Koide BX008]|uniref:Uncharacterized protein n=1 Tax=Amanita muscaria (strain Koide BX008) TaxID=946122 RepID=A0A0C2S1Z0_AMAMK|nr:hypothetical protein M378DRAFT_16893 [Amanita muscaria Koide BX008]